MASSNIPPTAALKSINDVSHAPFWLDDPNRPQPELELNKNISTELLILGGGFTGLCTALLAKEENPQRDIILIESGEIASGASGRNGGFVAASLTHGIQNGLSRWPREFSTLLALGSDLIVKNGNESSFAAEIRRKTQSWRRAVAKQSLSP